MELRRASRLRRARGNLARARITWPMFVQLECTILACTTLECTALVLACAMTALTGCGGLAVQPIPVTVSRYDALAPLSLAEFVRGRESLEQGDVLAARDAFERLFERLPDNIIVGIWLQDTELDAAAAESDAPATDPAVESRMRAHLAEPWLHAAEEKPSVTSLVLAARVAPTPATSAALLDKAAALDPACAWVDYARAYAAARSSDWTLAHEEIARAKSADPGHVWTYWLEAWITTRSGSVTDAAVALSAFVERAAADPRIQPRLLAESQLDLALVWTLLGEGKKARALAQSVDPRHVDAERLYLAQATIEQAQNELGPALAAAEKAERVAPGEVMPVLQQALLYDEWLDDPLRAEAAWRRVLDMARSSSELTAVLERTRAGVRIERFEARRAQAAREALPAGSAPDRP